MSDPDVVLGLLGVPTASLLLLLAAAFVGFFISTLMGVGGAMLIIPALLFELPAAEAVAVASPVMLFNNGFKLVAFWPHLDRAAALRVTATAVPAAAVAAFYAGDVDEVWMRRGIAAVIVVSVSLSWLRGLELRMPPSRLPVAGLFIGAVSGLCGAAGGPAALTMRSYGLVKEAFVVTIAALAVGMQLAKIPTYMATGLLPASRLPLTAVLAGSAVGAVWAGRQVLPQVSVARFKVGLDGFLLVVAAWLAFGPAR